MRECPRQVGTYVQKISICIFEVYDPLPRSQTRHDIATTSELVLTLDSTS